MTDGECARVVEDLVEQHYELLYRFAYRLSGSAADAEDLVQQAFLTAQTSSTSCARRRRCAPGC